MAKRPRQKPPAPSPPPPPPRPSAAWPLVQTAGRAGAALLIVFGIMFAIVYLAGQAGRVVVDEGRYAQEFDKIECEPRPGNTREEFLRDVRYYGADLENKFQVVRPDLKAYLKEVFERHPWVEAVESVEVPPSRRVKVGLKFRVPKLAVAVAGGAEPVVVDREAIILPDANLSNLTLFATPQPPPKDRYGEKWDSKAVRRAADIAAQYNPATIRLERGRWKVVGRGRNGKTDEWADG